MIQFFVGSVIYGKVILMSNLARQHQPNISKFDEEILVVPRSALFEGTSLHGLLQGVVRDNMEKYRSIIESEGVFLRRGEMEEDENYKQIIPYIVFSYNGNFFLMQRSAKASEKRLACKYTLGIGGHINKYDLEGKTIEEWGMREFHEEVKYSGKLSIAPIGIINDDTTPVGRVHLGLVFLVHGDSADITIRSELDNGQLLSIDECERYYDKMEVWSQLVFDALKKVRYM